MKMNVTAPAANMAPVTHPNISMDELGERRLVPWFWPDDELAKAVEFRRDAFVHNQARVLNTAENDPVVRAASQQLLWLQSHYLAERFPAKYAIEQSHKFGRVILNKVTGDAFSMRPEQDEWHPLVASGILGQEDLCIVQRKRSGKQVLVAGFLATPTHWNLSRFIDADMDKIHKNVSGYHKPTSAESRWRLKDTVDKTLDNLRVYPDGIISRNNQFIEYDPSLALEPSIESRYYAKKSAKDLGNRIYLRSERETLTRLPAPYDDFSVFTIKPNVYRMSDVRRLRGADFMRAIATNAILQEALKSEKSAKSKDKYDFTHLLHAYLSAVENP